jgi:hypothetical protein
MEVNAWSQSTGASGSNAAFGRNKKKSLKAPICLQYGLLHMNSQIMYRKSLQILKYCIAEIPRIGMIPQIRSSSFIM